MRAIDPIFVKPRFVERDWGRSDIGEWSALETTQPVAEAWLLDAANATDDGPFGRKLATNSEAMLGDLGRAPPKLRLIFPGQTSTVKSTGAVSLWTILEPGNPSLVDRDTAFHRPGDRIRAYDGAAVTFAAGSVALEASAAFLPTNDTEGPLVVRLPPVSSRQRATLFRHPALSVEAWILPDWSRVVPDGETCHVLTALTPGIAIDGRPLAPGRAIFIPASGRPLDIVTDNTGPRLAVAYPDATPTSVWRHTREPDPAAGQLPKPCPPRPLVEAVSAFHETAVAA